MQLLLYPVFQIFIYRCHGLVPGQAQFVILYIVLLEAFLNLCGSRLIQLFHGTFEGG